MAAVFCEGEGMAGKFHDFYNGCHGMYNLGFFRSHRGLAVLLAEKYKADIKEFEAEWDNETGWFKQ